MSCEKVVGPAPALRENVDTWNVAGIDGTGAQKLGKRGEPFSFVVMRLASSATVDAWYTSLEALAGTIVTVIDDFGTSYVNILIVRVGQPRKTVALPQGVWGEVLIEGIKVN